MSPRVRRARDDSVNVGLAFDAVKSALVPISRAADERVEVRCDTNFDLGSGAQMRVAASMARMVDHTRRAFPTGSSHSWGSSEGGTVDSAHAKGGGSLT